MKTLFAIVLVLTLLALTALLMKAKGPDRKGSYRQRRLMTDNEAEFFGRLIVALPDHYIFPQVAMSALLDTVNVDKKTAHADRLRIAQQRVDFVVCTRQCDVVAVVELDDKTHVQTKDRLRDERLAQGGIKTIRFQARSKPKADALRAEILAFGNHDNAEDCATADTAGPPPGARP